MKQIRNGGAGLPEEGMLGKGGLLFLKSYTLERVRCRQDCSIVGQLMAGEKG